MKFFSKETTPLRAALDYAERGFPVFPVRVDMLNGKIRKFPDAALTPKGQNDATVDSAQISEWWKKRPDALIAVVTGCASQLFIIDIDNDDDHADFSRHCQSLGFSLRDTAWEKTPRGYHYVYYYPETGRKPTNSQNALHHGVETKGERGCCIVSPSSYRFTVNGRRKDFLYRVGGNNDLLELPEPLYRRVQSLHALEDDEITDNSDPMVWNSVSTDAGIEALERLSAAVRTADSGSRHMTLLTKSNAAGHLIAEGKISMQLARQELYQAALSCKLHLEEDVAHVIDDGIRYALRQHQ